MKIIFDNTHGHVVGDKVFCEVWALPEGESEDTLLENGWLPTTRGFWYQSQSIRINSEKIVFGKKQTKILPKLKCNFFDYCGQKEIDTFFINFFEDKEFDMNEFYKYNSENYKLKIMSVELNSEIVAYTRFMVFNKSLLGFESGYKNGLPKYSLGFNSIYLLSNYGKELGKKYLYIFEGYKDLFPHKLQLLGSEYWEGEEWLSSDI